MYTSTFIRKEQVADGTYQFYFQKPEGFTFEAGQTLDFTLIDPKETDAEGNMRTFSLASAPHEKDLMIATRMRESAFKRTLGSMVAGDTISVDGPFGSFLLHENVARPAVFLAGGIGVTPFRSMSLDAVQRNVSHRIMLFYSNRKPKDAAFLAEFQTLAQTHPAFTLVATMTDTDLAPEDWSGERGYISTEMLEKYVPKESAPIYYLAGPEKMVSAMRALLLSMGISRDDIRFEEFSGY